MTQQKTISIPVPAALHTIVGAIFTLIALAAFWVHLALPNGHTNRSAAAAFGVLAGAAALIYWLWCGQQCNRSETRDVREAIEAAEAKANERETQILAALDKATDQLNENHAVIKELTGAVEALQDTYLADGRPPHDPALTQRGPPRSGRASRYSIWTRSGSRALPPRCFLCLIVIDGVKVFTSTR